MARRLGMRVVGPNCLGLVCNDDEVRLNATFNGSVPPHGGLAVASQSGGVGIVLMDLAGRTGLGVRYFVSLGNKADVSSNDLLAAWYDDDEVTCAALYLESFGNARKFARFARRFSERKPLLAVVGGRSSGGKRAGASHTAAAASSEVAVRTLFAQAGVIGCTDADELVDTARLLTGQPLPQGRRIAVVSNAGGLGVLAADAAADERLDVVEFSASLQAAIEGLVNQTTGIANPVDAGAGAEPAQMAAITDAVLGSGEVDAVVALLVATGDNDVAGAVHALAEVGARHPSVPMALVPLGGQEPECADVTSFRSAAAAMGALSRAATYAEWRRTEPSVSEPIDPSSAGEARAVARKLLDAPTADGWIAPAAASELLTRYRIELAGRIVRGADAAEDAATELGFPVAVKVADAGVVHRTEHRLVRTGLTDAGQVREVVAEFETHQGPVDVVVQSMMSGIEIAVGVIRDQNLGAMIMVAAGGVAVDVWDDHVFLLPPLGTADVVRALRSLRVWPLLEGFRGAPPAAVDDLARLVADVARLAVDVPELAELDLNPVMVSPDGCAVVDAKVRLASPDEALRDLPRQLRPVVGSS
jgi:acyl-CoA synthetase (NDP forming)